jgi:hypothetical protein
MSEGIGALSRVEYLQVAKENTTDKKPRIAKSLIVDLGFIFLNGLQCLIFFDTDFALDVASFTH